MVFNVANVIISQPSLETTDNLYGFMQLMSDHPFV
jgi:hypothetical protein